MSRPVSRTAAQLPQLVLSCSAESALYAACIVKRLDSAEHVTKGCCDAEFQALNGCVRAQLRARKGP
jgi:hypothetical protein